MTDQHWIQKIVGTASANIQELRFALDRPIVRLASTLIAGGPEVGTLDDGAQRPIRMEDVLYAFTNGAFGLKPLIVASWAPKLSFAEASVYLRTRDALYRADHNALKVIKALLPDSFQQVNRSVLANLALVEQLQLRGGASRAHTLTYAVELNTLSNWGFEQIKVGREYRAATRVRFGFPAVDPEQMPPDEGPPPMPTVHPVHPSVPTRLLYSRC